MKTSFEMLNDSYARAEKQEFGLYDLDDNSKTVVNFSNSNEYIVSIDNDMKNVYDCNCPHRTYRCKSNHVPCKHMVYVANNLNYDIDA